MMRASSGWSKSLNELKELKTDYEEDLMFSSMVLPNKNLFVIVDVLMGTILFKLAAF